MGNLPIDLDAQARQLAMDQAIQFNIAALANNGSVSGVDQVIKDAQAIYGFLCPNATTDGA